MTHPFNNDLAARAERLSEERQQQIVGWVQHVYYEDSCVICWPVHDDDLGDRVEDGHTIAAELIAEIDALRAERDRARDLAAALAFPAEEAS